MDILYTKHFTLAHISYSYLQSSLTGVSFYVQKVI